MKDILRLPKYNEVFGEKKKRIFKIFGHTANNSEYASRMIGENYIWALEPFSKNREVMTCVDEEGNTVAYNQFNPFIGIRPCTNYSNIENESILIHDFEDGLKLVAYGMYPKRKCTPQESAAIQTYVNFNLAQQSGKYYHRRALSLEITRANNGEPIVNFGRDPYFTTCYDIEHEYIDIHGNKFTNYNGTWYLVQPILWLVDEKEDFAITEEIISGGIPAGKCFDANSTTKIRSDLLSIILFVQRALSQEISNSYTSHLRFPSYDEPKFDFLKSENYSCLNRLKDTMNNEEIECLKEMIESYQFRKEQYDVRHEDVSSYTKRGK